MEITDSQVSFTTGRCVTDINHIKCIEQPLALMVFNGMAEVNAVIIPVRGSHAAVIFNGIHGMHYIVCVSINCHRFTLYFYLNYY